MKGNHSIRTNLTKKIVKIDPQLTKLDCVLNEKCAAPLYLSWVFAINM